MGAESSESRPHASEPSEGSPSRRVRLFVALGLVWVIWGSTYLAMRVAVAHMPPFAMSGTRFVLAGSTLLVVARLRGEPLPDAKAWLTALPIGALLFVCGNGFVVLAEQALPSSLAAVVCATTPLFASGMSAVRGEPPHKRELFGMLLGLGGVALLGWGSPIADASPRAILLVLAPIGWAMGSLLSRAQSKKPGGAQGTSAAGSHMVVGGVLMLLVSLCSRERIPSTVPWQSAAAWAYLVVFGSITGFTAYSWLLAHTRPAIAMSYAYVNPVMAVALGALLGHEGLSWPVGLATVLIGGGVMVALGASRAPAPAETRTVTSPRTEP